MRTLPNWLSHVSNLKHSTLLFAPLSISVMLSLRLSSFQFIIHILTTSRNLDKNFVFAFHYVCVFSTFGRSHIKPYSVMSYSLYMNYMFMSVYHVSKIPIILLWNALGSKNFNDLIHTLSFYTPYKVYTLFNCPFGIIIMKWITTKWLFSCHKTLFLWVTNKKFFIFVVRIKIYYPPKQ